MSSQIQCRQCGKLLPRSDFPKGQFKCPDCNWTQLLSTSGRSRLKKPKKGKQAAAAGESAGGSKPGGETAVAAPPEPEAHDAGPAEPSSTEPEAAAVPTERAPMTLAPLPVLDLDGLRALASADYRVWCTSLLGRFGYTTDGEAADGHLEFVRGAERILVDCIAFSERENVGRPEAQKLVDAMEERGIVRGMLLSPGSFENGCRAVAERSEATRIELVDGERLEETAREIADGPLAAWWS